MKLSARFTVHGSLVQFLEEVVCLHSWREEKFVDGGDLKGLLTCFLGCVAKDVMVK